MGREVAWSAGGNRALPETARLPARSRIALNESRPTHIRPVYVSFEEVSKLALIPGETELAAHGALVRELDLRRRIKVRDRVLPCQDEGRATVLQENTACN